MRIRIAQTGDINRIAELYLRHMDDSRLANLGRAFVASYLSVLVRNSESIVYVVETDIVCGFIIATTKQRSAFLSLLTSPKLAFHWLRSVINDLGTLDSLQMFLYPWLSSYPATDAEMLFIVVDPSIRGIGMAKSLIERILADLRVRAIRAVKVCTNADNSSINRLLSLLGFRLVRRFRFFGREMLLHQRILLPELINDRAVD